MAESTQILMAVATLIGIAAATPGPNNFVVLRVAAHAGVVRSLPVIAAIVLGSLVLLGVVASGLGAVLAAEPELRATVTLAGCLYLGWLGASLALHSSRQEGHGRPGKDAFATGPFALFAFQFLNPKGWVMLLTAASTGMALPRLAALLASITTVCLLLWSVFGALLQERLKQPSFRVWFDRIAGGLLAGSVTFLLL